MKKLPILLVLLLALSSCSSDQFREAESIKTENPTVGLEDMRRLNKGEWIVRKGDGSIWFYRVLDHLSNYKIYSSTELFAAPK